MSKKNIKILSSLIILIIGIVTAYLNPQKASLPSSSSTDLYSVVKVVDGDTVTLSHNDKKETVRLIGINTPETVDPRKPVECFGKEASAQAKALMTGKNVRIEKDASQGDYDKYERLLAYVFDQRRVCI